MYSGILICPPPFDKLLDFNVSGDLAMNTSNATAIDLAECFLSPKLDKSFIGFKEAFGGGFAWASALVRY
mgnify:CR=1 FL=1